MITADVAAASGNFDFEKGQLFFFFASGND
jgi:hypothetical protein